MLCELKVRCIICKKTFKRARDLTSHVKIMHKQISEAQRREQDILLDLFAKSLKLSKQADKAKQSAACANPPLGSCADRSVRICFVCSKVFRSSGSAATALGGSGVTTTSNLGKTFIRHMQIQHGLTENGERLVECPVCEKNFFSQQQMQRHMYTHVVWVQASDGK